jgi:hypothetical protein
MLLARAASVQPCSYLVYLAVINRTSCLAAGSLDEVIRIDFSRYAATCMVLGKLVIA